LVPLLPNLNVLFGGIIHAEPFRSVPVRHKLKFSVTALPIVYSGNIKDFTEEYEIILDGR